MAHATKCYDPMYILSLAHKNFIQYYSSSSEAFASKFQEIMKQCRNEEMHNDSCSRLKSSFIQSCAIAHD